MSRTIIYIHVNIILDFPKTNQNDSVLLQSECACLHQTVKHCLVFFLEIMKIPTQKGENSWEFKHIITF